MNEQKGLVQFKNNALKNYIKKCFFILIVQSSD